MEPALLGLILDSSVIIEAEREGQTVRTASGTGQQERRRSGDRDLLGDVAELVHGVYRAIPGRVD